MEAYSSLGKERVSGLLSNYLGTKMSLAIGFASRASVYDAMQTAYELSSAQCIVLALMHGLVNDDVAMCSLLGNISPKVQHLQSKHLKQWLKEDFQFEANEVYHAFSTATHFINSGLINIPAHVLEILTSIVEKYGVVELCCENGDKDTLNLLESLGVDIESSSNSEDSSPADSAKVYTEEENEADAHVSRSESSEEEEIDEGVVGVEPTVEQPQQRLAEPGPSTSVIVRQNKACRNAQSQREAQVVAQPVINDYYAITPADDDDDFDYEDYVEDYDSYDIDEEVIDYEDYDIDDERFSDESSDSGSNVETPEEEYETLEVSTLSCVVAIAQACVDSGILDTEAAQQQVNTGDETGRTLVHRAAEAGSVRTLKALLRLGINIDILDQWDRTPAYVAAAKGHLPALRALYHMGNADLMVRDNRGDSMLHTAADRGHVAVVRWLVRHGVDIEVSGRGSWRPLHRASQQGQLETVRLLLDCGACPNMMADVGGTALHRAAWWNKLEVAHLLIARGAHIDIADNRSDSPLHMAAKLGHLDMVKLLLDCGADPAVEDRSRMTPHDWAERNRRTDVADYMLSRGAGY